MTVFPYPELDAEKTAQYQAFPINLTRMMLHTKGLTVPYLWFAGSFRTATISAQVREQVIVRVGALTACEYEVFQHRPEVLRTGTSEELLKDLLDPEHEKFGDASLTALVKYVDSLVKNTGAGQNELDELRKHFRDNEVAEITLLAGTYVLCAAFIKSLQIPLDDSPGDWSAVDASLNGGQPG